MSNVPDVRAASKRWFAGVVFCIATSLIASSSHSQTTVPLTRIALIGFAAPFAEPNARNARDAALLAIEEANKKPLSINGQPVVFQLLEQDDKADVRTTEYVARFFVNSKVLGIVGHWNSATTLAAAPIYNEAGLAQISPTSWSSEITQKSYKTIFQMLGTDDAGLAYAANYLIKERQLKRVLVLDDSAYLGIKMADYFSGHAKKVEGNVTQRASINSKTSDVNAPLQIAQQTRPDLIFFSGRILQSEVLLNNVSRFQVSAKLLFTGSIVNNDFLQKAIKINNPVMAIVPSSPLEKRPGMAALEKKFLDRFGAPMSPFSAYVYDGVNLLVAATRKANSLEREKIINALHEIKYSGITSNIAFDAYGALLNPSYTLYGIEQQRWVPLQIFQTK